MMKEVQIWKFPISLPDPYSRAIVVTPMGTELHSVGIQDNKFVCWGTVPEADSPTGERILIVANTGATVELRSMSQFLGTCVSDNGIVWHVWEF